MSEVYQGLSKIGHLDPRVLYVLLMFFIVLPFLTNVNLPIVIHATTRNFYNVVESLPAGSVVVYDLSSQAGQFSEIRPGAVAVVNQLLKKDVKILFVTYQEDGPILIDKTLKMADQTLLSQKRYGEDYVVFGFVPGGEVALAAFAADMHKACPKDTYGTPVEQIPIMKNVHSAKDVALLVVIWGYGMGGITEIRQWGVTYETPMVIIPISMSIGDITPYYPRYVKSFIFGLTATRSTRNSLGLQAREPHGRLHQPWASHSCCPPS